LRFLQRLKQSRVNVDGVDGVEFTTLKMAILATELEHLCLKRFESKRMRKVFDTVELRIRSGTKSQ